MHEWTHDPRELLDTYVWAIRSNMLTYSQRAGSYALIVPRQNRQVFDAAGWQKRQIREYVFDKARITRRDLRLVGKAAMVEDSAAGDALCALRSPDDLLVIAAGGPAGGFGMLVPPWAGDKSEAVTRPVDGPSVSSERKAP
jgi:hypothetical protein